MAESALPILYFVEGETPTNAEFAKAEKFMNKGPVLSFVSLQNLDYNRDLMPASGVAGAVPEVYKEAYPVIDKAQPKAEKTKEE